MLLDDPCADWIRCRMESPRTGFEPVTTRFLLKLTAERSAGLSYRGSSLPRAFPLKYFRSRPKRAREIAPRAGVPLAYPCPPVSEVEDARPVGLEPVTVGVLRVGVAADAIRVAHVVGEDLVNGLHGGLPQAPLKQLAGRLYRTMEDMQSWRSSSKRSMLGWR